MYWETIILAFREIRRNVMRSSLTILGIVIGVAAVITLVTLGSGATAQVAAEISSLGSNLLQIRSGQGFRGPGGASGSAKAFKLEDAKAIAQQISGIAAVAPNASRPAQVIAGNTNWSTSITGSTNEFLFVRSWVLAGGRSFTESELRSGKAVCILGSTVKKELFGNQDPLGASVRFNGITCQVIGVFEQKGQSSGGNDQDDFVLIPLRTLHRRLAGNTDINAIFVSAEDGASTTKVKEDIEKLLRERRHIGDGQEDDFFVRDMQEVMSTLTGTTRILTTLLGAVAAVSLLVGGIGIMNIMLVSVTERTREIGIRLAIGAMEQDVLMQFLVEAVVLSSFGGLFGIAFGLGAAALGAQAMNMPFIFSPGIVAVAFLFSSAVGVIFGYFPARKAARLDPIEALRHE
ncbi:MAG: ABC transporter permease [Desulforhopalus sp.]|nr:ABC transporter permease [Desulforhopalus sp.]